VARPCPEESARRARPADRADIEVLRREARAATISARGGAALWGRDRPATRVDAVLDLALSDAPEALAVVGTIDDQSVGYLVARTDDTEGSGRVAVLEELWVTPEARGIGVGEAMMGVLTDWARARRCGALDAIALPGDRDTKNFFESHGLVARAISVSRRLE